MATERRAGAGRSSPPRPPPGGGANAASGRSGFWRADAVPPPVAAGTRKAPGPGGPLFDLWAEPGGKAIALTPEGAYVVIEARTRSYHLLFAEPAELRDRLPLVVHMGDVLDGEAEREMALRFLYRDLAAPAKPSRFVPGNAQRLMMQLQALDGDLAGASVREIAEAVCGAGAVADDWPCHRDRTRTLIRRGRWLMNGGYRSLLIPLRSRGSSRLRRLVRDPGGSAEDQGCSVLAMRSGMRGRCRS